MNKPSVIPRFAVSSVTGETESVDNLQVAATIYAFDVPLNKDHPYDVQAGDGIKGNRVIWNFSQKDGAGNSPKKIAKLFFDEDWCVANPSNPLAVCKRSFDEYHRLLKCIKAGNGINHYIGPACRVTNTRKAAVLLGLDHKLMGWLRNDAVTTFCFHEAAATDAALYDDHNLYEKLPDAAISYARGALLGHEAMVAAAKKVQRARVQHRGRTALIPKDISQNDLNTIEKLLYRK